MVSKELLEKARKCTSKEELLELAKKENVEISDENISSLLSSAITNKELSDDELENVTGGTCHSDYTYAELGITPQCPVGTQRSWYHPVITTYLNHCDLDTHGYGYSCEVCPYHYPIGATVYCKARSKEYDPYKNVIPKQVY